MPGEQDEAEQEVPQFSQNFRDAEIRSGDGAAGGRGGDIGSHNNVNSNNVVTHNTTIHIYSEEQLLNIPQLPIQLSSSFSSRRSASGSNLSRSPSPAGNLLQVSRPHFIANEDGVALDLSNSDQKTVLTWPFHGDLNQQWFLSDNGHGKIAFMCAKNRKYLAFRRLEVDAELFLSISPCYWEVSVHGDKYRVSIPKQRPGVPRPELYLSIGSSTASLRPNDGSLSILLHILPDSYETRAKIQALEVEARAERLIYTPSNAIHPEDDKPIDLYGRSQFVCLKQGKCLDLSGADNTTLVCWEFHGDLNQQWAFVQGDFGLYALKSLHRAAYIGYQSVTEDATLFCSPWPVYWELRRDEDGYNIVVPGSHLGIALVGQTASLRPIHEALYTRLYLLENSEAIISDIRRGNFSRTLLLSREYPPPVSDAPRPGHLVPFVATIDEPCFIASFIGAVLDLSESDRRVYAFGLHGNINQQWIVRADGRGGATIQSAALPDYVTYEELQLDAKLVLKPAPFTWEMVKDGDGYSFIVPGSNLALSMGLCARLRYLHEQPGTCIFLMDNSERSRSTIRNGSVSYSTATGNSLPINSSKEKLLDTANGQTKPDLQPTIDQINLPRHSNLSKGLKRLRNKTEQRSSRECVLQ